MQAVSARTESGPRKGVGLRRARKLTPYIGVLPFIGLVFIFLIVPTVSVVGGAFQDIDSRWSLDAIKAVYADEQYRLGLVRTVKLSMSTAVIGAFLGALLAWAVSRSPEGSFLRRFTLAAAGVLAQFGGVMLVFAFLATFGYNGLLNKVLVERFPESFLADPTWLYGFLGLGVVYTFFQIPLMFLVILPTIDNLRPQWREASTSLGGSTLEYWARVGLPVLAPSFIGAVLLLFANSFSAYATAAALISQGSPLTPIQIGDALSSEVGNANTATAKALSLGMVVLVGIVMTGYALLRRRVSKWEQ